MTRGLFALLLLTGLATGADSAHIEPTPVTLTPSSSKALAVAPFSSQGTAQCDGKGNLYFNVGTGPTDSVIYELLADGSHTVFSLTDKESRDAYYVSFRVAHDGRLWLLAGDKNDNPSVFEFHDDATSPAVTKLEAPEGLKAVTIRNFIVLKTGHILIHGYLDEKSPKAEQSHSYLADFDASGRLARKIVGKSFGADVSTWPSDTPALEGEDGLIYLLELDRVLVVSQAGERVKEIILHPPEPGYRPSLMYLAGHRLVVGFYKQPAGNKPTTVVAQYALIDTSSGEQIRLYQPNEELGNNLVCFSSEGFTFYRVDHHRIKLVTATAE